MQRKEYLKNKRVFVGFNDAGSPGIYSFTREMRKMGYKVDFYGFDDVWVKIPTDFLLRRPKNRIIREVFGLYQFSRILFKYDIFHLNFGTTFFWYRLNYLLLKLFRKKIINTFRGTDVYDVKKSIEEYGAESPYSDLYKVLGSKKIKRRSGKIKFLIRNSDKVVLMGPWLINSVPNYDLIIPYSRDIEKIHSFKQKQKKSSLFTVVHAPTNNKIKGTRYVIDAIKNLNNKGVKINLVLPNKIPIDELYKQISKADLVIDQLLLGWYGGFAVEAMALEKPVISYLKDEYLEKVSFGKDIPIINANVKNLEIILEQLINTRNNLPTLGKKSHKFVQKVHDKNVIARQYLELYSNFQPVN